LKRHAGGFFFCGRHILAGNVSITRVAGTSVDVRLRQWIIDGSEHNLRDGPADHAA